MTERSSISGREYQVYLLRNPEGGRYIGISAEVERRYRQHNEGLSRWTCGRGPWRLVWTSRPLPDGHYLARNLSTGAMTRGRIALGR